jgi:transcriptional regulator with XRE-family HTH domain
MARRSRTGKRTRLQSAADDATAALQKKLGAMLRDGRTQRGWTQAQAAARAGISRSEWSGLELGRRPATLLTINRAAFAISGGLAAYVQQASAADQPRDAVHLHNQELIIRTALAGGWRALPEEPIDRDARTSRAVDVLLYRRRLGEPAEYAMVEVIDWFSDVGEPIREWSRRLAALERYAIARMAGDDPLPTTGGCWVVRGTQRNRRLVREHRHFFRARFAGSATAWLEALAGPTAPMPPTPSLLWAAVDGRRLTAARLGWSPALLLKAHTVS